MSLAERLIARPLPDGWTIVYDLFADSARVRAMQETSLSDRTDAGLDPNPLVGSSEWISEVEHGRRPVRCVSGMIRRVYWGSMADYPEFTIVTHDKDESNWTREGDIRLYVPGIGVELFYVEHAWKQGVRGALGEYSQIKLAIWLERSPQRSSAIAPGPGEAGYELARENGDVVHYLLFPDVTAAQEAASELEVSGVRAQRGAAATTRGWYVTCWGASNEIDQDIRRLSNLAASTGGDYDGGERVAGSVWGPQEGASAAS